VGIIIPENREVATWQGLHLFHYAMSNCSQRVRMLLEEKELPWTGHHVDLARGEHTGEWYQAINPKAVVPTLVHDGTVIVESSDILRYLDERFPHPPLCHATGIDPAAVDRWLSLADAAQSPLKLLSHEFLFKPGARKSERELKQLQRTLHNLELLAFHRRFSSPEGFSREEIQGAVAQMHDAFARLDRQLTTARWLAGENFSIADIAWVVNIHRLQLMRFPLRRYPQLLDWYQRMARRDSYRKALAAYEPVPLRGFFRVYSWLRVRLGPNPFA